MAASDSSDASALGFLDQVADRDHRHAAPLDLSRVDLRHAVLHNANLQTHGPAAPTCRHADERGHVLAGGWTRATVEAPRRPIPRLASLVSPVYEHSQLRGFRISERVSLDVSPTSSKRATDLRRWGCRLAPVG
jgi:hypothetical protein